MRDEFKIFRLDNFGRGISYFNGKVIFIENAIDGENVDAEVIDSKKKLDEAICKRIIDSSIYRVKPKCPYYDECGGCNIMHMDYIKQLKFKEEKVKDVLKKFADIDDDYVREIIPTKESGYRNKITLKVENGQIGFYKRKSYELVCIDKCLMASPKINEIIERLNELKYENIEEITIKSTSLKESMVIFKVTGKTDKEYYKNKLEDITDTLVLVHGDKTKTVFGKGYITDKVGDYYFKITSLAFFQVNMFGIEKLYNQVRKYGSLQTNENVLDLYCGTGTIGIYLSDTSKSVKGLEINGEAVEAAQENIKLNNIANVEVEQKDVSKEIEKYKDIELVVVDPPRSGLSKKALKNILDINPNRIVYVSCDPGTLARDINYLKEYYNLKEVTPVDMFPNTYHVETVSLLKKK